MPKFNVQYVHVEETTYTEWVEAESEASAIEQVEDNPNFTKTTRVQGIEMKDFAVIGRDES